MPEPLSSQPRSPRDHTSQRRASQRRSGVVIGVLALILGFGIAVQVHTNSAQDSLANAREDDLVAILANQNELADRRRDQLDDLQRVLAQLQSSGDTDGVAQQQAEQQSQALSVLLGTVAATGPGVTLTITDPKNALKAEDLLDVVEELRGAGAEAIQFGSVRVITSTHFVDTSTGIEIDSTPISPPYTVDAIGDADTMTTAMNIPGGVTATARAGGGDVTIVAHTQLSITAVREIPVPKYARETSH